VNEEVYGPVKAVAPKTNKYLVLALGKAIGELDLLDALLSLKEPLPIGLDGTESRSECAGKGISPVSIGN